MSEVPGYAGARACLWVVCCPCAGLVGQSVKVGKGGLLVGRAGRVAVSEAARQQIGDPAMSRAHFAVTPLGACGLGVRDLGSRNGTRLALHPVGSDPEQLPAGAPLRAGDTVFVRGNVHDLGGARAAIDIPGRFMGILTGLWHEVGPLAVDGVEILLANRKSLPDERLKELALRLLPALRPGEAIDAVHLGAAGVVIPPSFTRRRPPQSRRYTVPPPETLRWLLAENGGSVRAAAAGLGVHRRQLYRWMRRSGIDPATYRNTEDDPSN